MVPGSLSNREFMAMILKENIKCEFYLYPHKYPHHSDGGICISRSMRDISRLGPFPVPEKLSLFLVR